MALGSLLEVIVELFVEVIVRPIISTIFYVVLYNIGKIALRLLTLGRYPPDVHSKHNKEFVAFFGLVPLVVLLLVVTGQFAIQVFDW